MSAFAPDPDNPLNDSEDLGPSFAEGAISKLRGMIESGQAAMGAGGPGSNNRIVNPLMRDTDDRPPGGEKGGPLPVEQQQQQQPLTPRSKHIEAAKVLHEERQKKAQIENLKHKKDRKDKLIRYIVLIVCVTVIILSLLGMSAISRAAIGKWWHGQPDPTPDTTISHSKLFTDPRLV